VDLEKDLSPEERLVRAHDLGVSAFLGDTIYNFGELVRASFLQRKKKVDKEFLLLIVDAPILDELNGNQHERIKKLLFSFNEGNIGKFEVYSPKRFVHKSLKYNVSSAWTNLERLQLILQEN